MKNENEKSFQKIHQLEQEYIIFDSNSIINRKTLDDISPSTAFGHSNRKKRVTGRFVTLLVRVLYNFYP
jgi:hypothetical protein